jgi:tRNA(His) 5'-end guanylyltransferase
MKLELIEETNIGSGTMYVVRADGSSLKWFAKKEDAEAFYDSIVADPTILEPVKNILKSSEINVSLIEQNS